MAKVVLNEKLGLWRIIDPTTGKVVITNDYKAVDLGGQRSQMDAWRLLSAHADKLALDAKKQKSQ